MDDVRPLSREAPLPVYGNRETIEELQERFSYVFKETQRGGGKPKLLPVQVSAPVAVGGLLFSPVPVKHGALDILGWRIEEEKAEEAGNWGGGGRKAGGWGVGNRACAVYLTDTSAIPDSSWPLISGPDILIIGALRTRPHETHFTFEEALDTAVKTGAPRSFLTHICHDYNHREIEAYCRSYQENRGLRRLVMGPAYDGLELIVETA
jgi:phosphoribosyl 1,2-cyclic phosphate phosphodiesterase